MVDSDDINKPGIVREAEILRVQYEILSGTENTAKPLSADGC